MVCCGLFGMTEVSLNFKQTFLEAMAKRGSNFKSKKLRKIGKKMGCWGWEAQSPRESLSVLQYPDLWGFVWFVMIVDTRNMFTCSVFRRVFFDVIHSCVSTVGGEKVIGDETKFTTVWYLQLHDHKRCAGIKKVFNHITNRVYSLSYFRSSFTWSQICFASSFALDSRHTDTNTKNTCSVN